ncbi:MAG: dethiobiotin synthase [Planctomycetota bacterium]|nr:MAG: dethiobiotin synthase [Planctomycetota bacterium]
MSEKKTVPGVFVTGTDTGVGKTFHSVRLIRCLQEFGWLVGAYKPAASGWSEDDPCSDPQLLWQAIGGCQPLLRVCPQRFRAPLSPPEAAAAEGRTVDQDLLMQGALWWRQRCDFLVVEGVGGVLSPLSDALTCADWAEQLGLPVLLIVPDRLGAVNQALTAAEAILRRRLRLAGILLNTMPNHDPADTSLQTNAKWIARFLPGVAIYPNAEEWAADCCGQRGPANSSSRAGKTDG